MRRLVRASGRIAVIAIITFGLYLAVDIAVGLALHRSAEVAPEDLRTQPAYASEPYATLDFSREKAEIGPNRTLFGTRLYIPAAHRGKLINIERLPPTGLPYRRTANPPRDRRPVMEVLLLGGSTVLGIDVPDDLTIASALSASLNAMDPAHDYQVVNAGVTGVDSTGEADRLAYELSHDRRPSVVVVVDGGMDIFKGLYLGYPGLRAPRSGLNELFQAYFPLNIYRWLVNWMSLRAVRANQKVMPAHVRDQAELDVLAEKTIDVYLHNQAEMSAAASSVGARFITVLQPSPYSTDYIHKTPDLGYVDGLVRHNWPGLAELMTRYTRRWIEACRKLRSDGIEALDLSAVFKDKSDNIFLDFGHYNSVGNRVIAQRIAETLLQHAGAAR
ncbi:MAG TPA: hypothetical protein VFA23_05375 [Dongiaceae bacterium]|nr:hypothetical protein [Dongiaceae bacterium]